ncbi:unnamed protein product [Oppiella nova]|uniref:Uncharacterized protein n=1 Tax=Oppiella nova TaxID=334625 RepID=A0A7R9MQL8_9ACAR|nr:unnamed protein product [Oppiella nova]CAG2180617.1 unnamed protein product [Oppiella nova]
MPSTALTPNYSSNSHIRVSPPTYSGPRRSAQRNVGIQRCKRRPLWSE